MPKKLRVVVNRRPNAEPNVAPFPVTEPVEWVFTEYQDNKAPPDSLIGADVYIGTDFTKEMGAAADSLKAILIAAAGYDRIDPDAVPEGCTVANAYHHEAPIAEWVMAVAVALDHELFKSDRTFREGSWEMWPGRHGVYRELMGRTFGIVGFGAIGRRVARLAQAYEMPVIAAGRADTAEGELYDADYIGGGKHAREYVLSEADFVLISTPLGPATHGLIGEHELSLMKPTAYIINPARGHIIDETALYNALKNRTIAGAAIDTWYQYPETADRRAPTIRTPLLGTRQHHHGPPPLRRNLRHRIPPSPNRSPKPRPPNPRRTPNKHRPRNLPLTPFPSRNRQHLRRGEPLWLPYQPNNLNNRGPKPPIKRAQPRTSNPNTLSIPVHPCKKTLRSTTHRYLNAPVQTNPPGGATTTSSYA